jgi:hypothetical protein
LIPANLAEAFGLLINCSEASPCHPLLPTVQHTLKKAVEPEGLLYLASKQFTTEDFEKVKLDKMITQNAYSFLNYLFLSLHLFTYLFICVVCVCAHACMYFACVLTQV